MGLRRRRPRAVLPAIAAIGVGVGAVVLLWFEPQALLIDDRVDDPVPVPVAALPSTTTTVLGPGTSASGPATAPTTSTTAGPLEVAAGEFVSRDHGTTGTARVLDLGGGRRVLRLEELDTDNGPDLYLYLTANPAGGPEGAFDDGFVDLGRLQGNQGNQNYDLPPDVDLARYATVVIWCDRFDSAFGAADLLVA